jgi:hypothetical protein|tara:strand:- start:1145 stop:1828 length:684 start_codon:yes stop_codon:yes gene_type:complete
MSIETYNELQAHLADTINRTDLSSSVTTFSPSTLDSQIVRAISLAEQRIQNDIMSRGGIGHMETVDDSINTVGGTETVTMPTGFLALRSLTLQTNPITIMQGFPDINSLYTTYPSTAQQQPRAYSIVGVNTIYLRPVPDGAYDLRIVYYKALDKLSASNTTNWLIENGIGVYVGAAMVELCMYIQDYNATQIWEQFYDAKLADLMRDDRVTRFAIVPTRASVQVAIA